MPVFQGGPQDGQTSIDPGLGDPTIEQMLSGGGGLGAAVGPPEGSDDLSPSARFDRIHSDVRTLLTEDDGQFSDQDKLIVSKVETLLSGFKAGREKEQEQAMQGKLSPGLMGRASAGSGGGAGY